jgi:hypothetical protein
MKNTMTNAEMVSVLVRAAAAINWSRGILETVTLNGTKIEISYLEEVVREINDAIIKTAEGVP